MSTTPAAHDAEDVNDFLKRIQELGNKRDQEDEERNRKLEEEILQGRKERQARRAERARSISPAKESPLNTPQSYRSSRAESPGNSTSRAAFSPSRDLQPPSQSPIRETVLDDTMDRLTGGKSPTKENSPLVNENNRNWEEISPKRTNSIRASPSSAMPPSRSSTLSWQQRRPNSQASDRPRSRPLSMIATENAARSPRATPEPSPGVVEDQAAMTRDQISQSLASKDPTWFRQTSDRGATSAAYRKNQVEDNTSTEPLPMSSPMQLPGMGRGQIKQSGDGIEQVTDQSLYGNQATKSLSGTSLVSSGIGSPVPVTSAQRLPPPGHNLSSGFEQESSGRTLAMSPSQGRISPERMDRPASPTKGMGGFVQSAMMKRSDSVSKRWSVQSPPGLSRGNSIASNRISFDPSVTVGLGGIMSPSIAQPTSPSRDNSPIPYSRPTSSHSNATVTREIDPSGPSGASSSVRSSITIDSDTFVKPSLPASRSQGSLKSIPDQESEIGIETRLRIDATPPSSPSRMNDTRRWSPTKSSWLESALNKPESPRLKTMPQPQQPNWMSEISKAKARGGADEVRSQPVHKHEVNIGGLLRSPPMGGPAKPLNIAPLTTDFISAGGQQSKATDENTPISALGRKTSSPNIELANETRTASEPGQLLANDKPRPSTTSMSPKPTIPIKDTKKLSPAGSKIKPETPPKKDFRSNLKPRQLPSDSDVKQEPEFKNVFGQLRRTKTQNYIAPDELKSNIMRGKAGLSQTGGPQKSERKDEFKDAILKKKDDFMKAQQEGTGVTRLNSAAAQPNTELPEALAKKAALGRISTPAGQVISKAPVAIPTDKFSQRRIARDQPNPSLHQESSAPARMQAKGISSGKLAERFNPSLAGILAKGPPPATSESPQALVTASPQQKASVRDSAANNDVQDTTPQLTHMTKARARGPRRKAPSAITTKNKPSDVTDITPQSITSDIPETANQKKDFSPPVPSKLTPVEIENEPENPTSQPSSPRKLDFKRRSKFLEEVPNKNEKAKQQLETPNPSTPSKKANIAESFLKNADSESMPGQSNTPTTKYKPTPSPKSPVLTQMRGHTVSTSPEVFRFKAVPVVSANTREPPTSDQETSKEHKPTPRKLSGQVKVKAGNHSVSTVKNTSSVLNRFTATPSPQATVKAPIKLPTQEDENAAMINAGLRSLDSNSVQPVAAGSPVQGTTREKNSDSTAILPLPSTNPKPKPKPLMSPPSFLSSSSMKTANPPSPQRTETTRVLTEFFGKVEKVHDIPIDTATLLSAKPEHPAKIKSLRFQLHQLLGGGKKQVVPTHQERILFENNMYICTHTFLTSAGKKATEVYLWIGDDISEPTSQDAVNFARKEAKSAGGKLLILRQGKETSEFIEGLGGVIIIRRGSSNKYDSLAPHIICGRRHAGQIAFDEVDFTPGSLCSGFPYLISTQTGKLYLWKGRGSGVDELSCARLIGMDFGISGEIIEIEEGKESAEFLSVFGNNAKVLKSADHWRMKPNYSQYSTRLFCTTGGLNTPITEITPFSQADISPSNIYVLDAFFEVYIIVGAHSQSQYPAFCMALVFAQEYGILAAGMEDRPFVPVSTVVLEGVPRDLKFVFRKWSDVLTPTIIHSSLTGLSRGRSLRVVPLNAALDATRF